MNIILRTTLITLGIMGLLATLIIGVAMLTVLYPWLLAILMFAAVFGLIWIFVRMHLG